MFSSIIYLFMVFILKKLFKLLKMEDFELFLKSSKAFSTNLPNEPRNIHIVMGNESCDLDSTVATLVLAYFLSKTVENKNVIPILNVSRELFSLRTETCLVLNEVNVALENLIFRDEVVFDALATEHNLTVSLVDHHILSRNDSMLAEYVTQVFDHRPIDLSHPWNSQRTSLNIEQVGSCCTLIAQEVLSHDCAILTKPLARLLHETIIYDTIGLKPENHKATSLDISIVAKLEQMYDIQEDHQELFDKLWQAHNDVSSLTPKQLLYKDMKLVDGVFIPGLPMLVEEYLTLKGAIEALESFADEHNVTCLILVGLNASKQSVKRDLAIYSKTTENQLRQSILNTLDKHSELDFQFSHKPTGYDQIHLLCMGNIKISRKQLIVLVKEAWQNYVLQL